MESVAIRTIVPILLLIGMGFLSRKKGILKAGDERVLNAYLYYFALPALFFVNMAEADFTAETFRFVLAAMLPILAVVAVFAVLYLILRFSRSTFYLLIVSTVFGSQAFFGIPFITFAFPGSEGERMAAMSTAAISIISVAISITVLEAYRLEESSITRGVRTVARKLSRNPLILSILFGILVSLARLEVPAPVSTSLHMLGGTTSAVAIFVLGAFFYGREYKDIPRAFALSLLRAVFLPVLALLVTAGLGLPLMERSALVLMHGMPVAVSMIVLSERYDFHRSLVATLILLSSLGAGIYLNLWLLVLGY
jgi:predicted permease